MELFAFGTITNEGTKNVGFTMALTTLRPRLSKAVQGTHQRKRQWGHGRGGRPWRRKRDEIFKRDKYTCQVCYRVGGELELDHIINVARGGPTDDNNLQTLCTDCHRVKTMAESKAGGPDFF